MIRARDLLCVCTFLCVPAVLTGRAAAQEGDSSDRADRQLLDSRERGLLHSEGDPLKVIGIDASGHDFRARTPALARVERRPVEVDADELYRRRLAAFAGEASSSAPLPPGPDADVAEEEEQAPGGGEGAQGTRTWAWLALPAVLLVVLFATRRREPASV